jgi:hypothetical protein
MSDQCFSSIWMVGTRPVCGFIEVLIRSIKINEISVWGRGLLPGYYGDITKNESIDQSAITGIWDLLTLKGSIIILLSLSGIH